MTLTPSPPETAYATALSQLKRLKPVPNQAAKLFTILPLAILDARRGQNLDSIPPYQDLTPEERFAVKILYEVIAEVGDPIANYPRVLAEISLIKTMIPHMMKGGSQQQGQQLISMAVKIVNTAREYGAPDPKIPRVQTPIDNFTWLEANRDPDLWHIIVKEANFDLNPTERFVEWVIGQPDCDRATAAYLFLIMTGPAYVAKPPETTKAATSFPSRIITSICARSQSGDGFPNSNLTLSEHGQADDQRGTLKQMLDVSTAATAARCPVPVNLLATPFSGRRAKSPYIIESECYIENGW